MSSIKIKKNDEFVDVAAKGDTGDPGHSEVYYGTSTPDPTQYKIWINPEGSPSTVNSLPSVTTSDNGKVLQVVNGAWVAAAIPSASGQSF